MDEWVRLPFGQQRFDNGMAAARAERESRAAAAAAGAVNLAHQLAEPAVPAPVPDEMWTVRGEQRTRRTFGWPHPADFRGGLPLPGPYPRP